MKIYLDLCVYNRPFDYQGQLRISIETQAFIAILEQIEKGIYELIISDILIYENNKNPDFERKRRISSYFKLAKKFIKIDENDCKRAKFLKELGFDDIDALHIVLAEKGNVDYFITCDDKIVKIYKKNKEKIKVKIINLLEFVNQEVK